MMISTGDLSRLPDPERLRRTLQSMAMLDAILCPDWQYRYYSFNSTWAPGEEMGSMRDGSGDHFFAHFSHAGCWLKGFVHECPLCPGVLTAVPEEFAVCLNEPAFCLQDVTFCIWKRHVDLTWQIGAGSSPVDLRDDGSERLLTPLDGQPETYQEWAVDYYERNVEITAVEHVYRLEPLTPEVVTRLNPELSVVELAAEIQEIGYPQG
jgi:hypothetical protein